jgi:hypothetical protein
VSQVVEHLLCKCEVLSSNPNTAKKKAINSLIDFVPKIFIKNKTGKNQKHTMRLVLSTGNKGLWLFFSFLFMAVLGFEPKASHAC